MELRGSELAALLDTPEELRHLWFDVDESGNKRFKPFKTPTFRKVLAEVGKADTDAYVKLSKTLSDAGLNSAYLEGETVGLSDLAPPIDTAPFFEKMDAALAQVSKDLPEDQQIATRNKIHSATLDKIHDAVMAASEKSGNSLHRIVTSGARGNPVQFRAMVSSPGTYVDYKGRQLPIFVRKGFNEGVDPVDYLASSFGTRSSIISIKNCLEENTEVQLVDGSVKKIKDIKVGDMVWGSDMHGNLTPVKVLRVFNNGNRPVYSYQFKRARGSKMVAEVICTEDHKFLQQYRTCGKRTEPSYLKPTVRPVVDCGKRNKASFLLPTSCKAVFVKEEPFAWLLGYLMGNGYLGGKGQVMVSITSSALAEEIRQKIGLLDLNLIKSKGENYSYSLGWKHYDPAQHAKSRVGKGKQGFSRSAPRPPLQTVLDRLGMSGSLAHTKKIPKEMWGWSDNSLLEFLAGYMCSDGSVYKVDKQKHYYASYASVSEELAEGISNLLRFRFGIHFSGYHADVGTFFDSSAPKQRRLFYYVLSRKAACRKLYELLQTHLVPSKKELYRNLAPSEEGMQPPAVYTTMQRTYVGERPTYDIEVDHPDHLFALANGIITSNSTAKGGDIAKQLQNVAARMVVREKDCGTGSGIALKPEDDSLYHRVLAKKTGEYDAGTVVTDKIANDLRSQGKPVRVRSPLTCQTPNGLCAKCAGAGPRGDLRPIGFHAGSVAASSVGEPLAQGALCLVEGTLVRMADGSVKKIEEIIVGDRVLGVSLGEFVTPVKVLNTFANGERDVREFTFSTKKGVTAKVTCTPDHNILCRCKIKEAGASSAGKKNRVMPVGTRSNNFAALCQHKKDFRLLPRNYSKTRGKQRTYDIEVDHPNHLFLLANGLVVSNSAKHLGGMGSEKKKFTGIGVVAQLLQSPENFPDRAAVAKTSGRVKAIEPAPQGGNYIIDDNDNRLYVEPGLNINVAEGDEIDAGDVLSDGLVDTEDVVESAGLGAGRAAMVEQLGQVLSDSNAKTDRRNLEVLSRASVNFLENTSNEERDGYLPGDVLTYDDWRKNYSPPKSMHLEDPEKAVGKYLEEPALHYTLKTPVTRRVASDLKRAGVERVAVSDERGDIEPGFLRLRTPYASEEDWIVAQTGSYLKSRMANAVTRGADSVVEGNDHYAPALARGQHFGKTTDKTGKF